MRAGAVAASLRAFAAERAPVVVVALLAAALSAGPWALVRGDAVAFLRGALVTGLVLFILRAVDDLRSVAHDRLAHPWRGLPSGRIPRRPLAVGAALLAVGAALAGGPLLAGGLSALAACYAAYYARIGWVPLVLRPALVNGVFFAIPWGIGLLTAAPARPDAGPEGDALPWLAFFFWLAAIGHDYAHEVHAEGERPAGPPTVAQRIGPRAAALIALGCYVAAGGAGVAVVETARASGITPALFAVALLLCFGWVGPLLARLVVVPSREHARRLYVAGVACFALPSLCLAADRLLGR